jgi:putative hemolysin
MPAIAQALPRARTLHAHLAESPEEIRQAQRLRAKIFGTEMGVRFETPGIDEDRFDPYCDHLLVRDSENGRLVGTTRLLRHERVMEAGGFYTETEFELSSVLRLPGRFVEVGRTCIHPDYRTGAAIATLWSGLTPYLTWMGYDYLIGCASIPLGPGIGPVRALVRQVLETHGSPEDRRVVPRRPLPGIVGGQTHATTAPPLLKAYLRLGATLCGEAAWDPEFKTADLVVLLERTHINPRYARHFLRSL